MGRLLFGRKMLCRCVGVAWVGVMLSACGGGGGGGGPAPPSSGVTPATLAPTVASVLKNELMCEGVNVKIRAQDMTVEQMQQSCEKLVVETADFHALLGTDPSVPIINDFNDNLEVVVFDDWNNYNEYGARFLGIDTDNGGIYIEGNPGGDANQARFYAHEADWLRPAFVVWNLEHEFTHYLDGRYVQYGGFGFYNNNVIWWAEGLAEYMTWKAANDKAKKLLQDTPEVSWPSLATVFDMTYQSEPDLVYRWSYWVHRFMFEEHAAQMRSLSAYLKSGGSADYISYKAVLEQWEVGYQSEFTDWLRAQKAAL